MSTACRPAVGMLHHITGPTVRLGRANFASSSRVGLDFTLPRFAPPSNTTTTSPTITTTTTERPTTTPVAPTFSRDVPSHLATPQSDSLVPSTPKTAMSATRRASTPPSRTPTLNMTEGYIDRSFTAKDGTRIYRFLPPSDAIDPRTGLADTNLKISHTLHVRTVTENLHLAFTDRQGVIWGTLTNGMSGGEQRFKGAQRTTYEACFQTALREFERIVNYSRQHSVSLCLSFNGFRGEGRNAVMDALAAASSADMKKLITRIEDKTKLKIRGQRPPKKRRV